MNIIHFLNLEDSNIEKVLKPVLGELLTLPIQQPIIEIHKQLLKSYSVFNKNEASFDERTKLYMLNLVLRSALRSGDFLNLSSWIYKTDKLIESNRANYDMEFLILYYEATSLYHFYDNDLQRAIKGFNFILKHDHLPIKTIERCFYYFLTILLAGYLPLQAEDLIIEYEGKHPFLKENPLLWAIKAMVALDNHKDRTEVLNLIATLYRFRTNPIHQPFVDQTHGQLLEYVNKSEFRATYVRMFPEHWEQLLHIDLWLRAKTENKFYYNLIMEDWQKRKTVFT